MDPVWVQTFAQDAAGQLPVDRTCSNSQEVQLATPGIHAGHV